MDTDTKAHRFNIFYHPDSDQDVDRFLTADEVRDLFAKIPLITTPEQDIIDEFLASADSGSTIKINDDYLICATNYTPSH